MAGKYQPLSEFLASSKTTNVRLSYTEIERIIDAKLPRSAHEYRPWWANQSDPTKRPQAKAWLDAGYKVAHVTPQGVVFEKR